VKWANVRDLGPVLDFMSALWALDHALQSASKRMEAQLGVTAPQRLVVRIVGRFPGLAPGEVAEILHLHPSTLTGILKRLEERNLLARRPDPADARRSLLKLTPKGRAVDALRSGTVETAVRRALRRLPNAAVRAARDAALTLSDELGRIGG
jgi:DNA-binding MarR family transcriptional regulator